MRAVRDSREPAFVLRQAELAIRESHSEAMPVHAPLPNPLPEGEREASHRITAVGHAHIDTAWEWPIREAKRKVARSWSTQLALMDEHPDYIFAASQPAQYAWMRE